MSTRAERLTAALDGAGVDLMLVTNIVNVRYLTGFTGSNGLVLIGQTTRVFFTLPTVTPSTDTTAPSLRPAALAK